MRRNQHGAHTQGVEVVEGVVGSVRSADAGANADGAPSQMALDPWLMRVLQVIAYILRLPTGSGEDVELGHALALRRVIHVFCLELDREMMRQQPASDLPIDLSMQVRNVLTLAFLRMKPPEIAARLGRSPRTVTSYLRDAARLLGVSGTENAVKEAFVRRLLLFDDIETLLGLPAFPPHQVNEPSQEQPV